MEKNESLVTIKAELDPTSTGTSQRYTVGEKGDGISGAIYLSKHIELPCELTIQFSKEGEEDDISNR